MEFRVKSPVRSPSPSQPLSPTRLAKLPPISLTDDGGSGEGEGARVTPALMQSACSELRDSMGHLLNEVRA